MERILHWQPVLRLRVSIRRVRLLDPPLTKSRCFSGGRRYLFSGISFVNFAAKVLYALRNTQHAPRTTLQVPQPLQPLLQILLPLRAGLGGWFDVGLVEVFADGEERDVAEGDGSEVP